MTNKETNVNKTRGKVYFTSAKALYLPPIARSCNYDFKVNYNATIKELINDIVEYSPDYLVAEIRFQNYKPQMETLAQIKQLLPHTTIIVTGEPFLTYNNNVTYENPFISYVIMGEVEFTLRDILNGVPDNEILGICYTDENMQAIKNEQRPYIENLDELPFPIRNTTKDSIEFIEVSRGCPHHCFFCNAVPLRGNKTRYRSVDNVIDELKECINKYKVTNFVFKADNFNANKSWVTELCNKIIENNLKIKWSANILPKDVDNELAEIMFKSGCVLCNIGIESGTASILNNLEKNITLNDIKNTVNTFKKNRIAINNCFLFGLPWETEETAEETIKLAIELDSDEVSFYVATPFPGTKFFIYSMLNKLIIGEINFNNAIREPVIKTHKLSIERLKTIQKDALRRFYVRPEYIFKNLLNFNTLIKIARIFFSTLRTK